MRNLIVSSIIAFSVVACAKDAKPPATATGVGNSQDTAEAAPAKSSNSEVEHPDKVATKGNINISDRIRKACGLSDTEAFFAYNSSVILPEADAILGKLAACFVSGPLKGENMLLVGHADPRGDEEYNMLLGGRRADNVKGRLAKKGLPDARMSTSSRGEMDASGEDEAGWAKDRRVDIMIDDDE